MNIIPNYFSACCLEHIYGKGVSKGVFCSKCNKEVFETCSKDFAATKRTGRNNQNRL